MSKFVQYLGYNHHINCYHVEEVILDEESTKAHEINPEVSIDVYVNFSSGAQDIYKFKSYVSAKNFHDELVGIE